MVGARSHIDIATCGTLQKPCRWADVEASEGEDEEEVWPSLAAPAVDDTCRDPPLSSPEDSRDGLNLRLSGAAGLGAASPDTQAPKDFAFLLASAVGETESQDRPRSLRGSWRPNLNAPEFIPTLSHSCPLVATVILDEDGRAVSRTSGVLTPEKGGGPSGGLPPLERRRRGGAKARPTAIEVSPAKKRTSESEPPEKMQPPDKMPMPEVSEEDWQHRIEMRRKAIDVGKKTREYQWYAETKQGQSKDEPEPPTPNPADRTVSKRRWKYDVMQWRIALKQRHLDEGGASVASTEEWQSVFTATTEDPDGCSRSIDLDDGLSV
mmetsp:Transcript_20034/g.53185  ORF Transcript_20034/g.53185 Transcript_20034/m.53185 type:complete len:322 (+) Transcript_20034:128-1093(+)